MPLERTRAIVIRNHGGPEVLIAEDVDVPAPGPGQLCVRHTAISVNYHDCYVRSGQYRTLALPGVPGLEAVGVVESVGPDVTAFASGDRIGWLSSRYGGYSTLHIVDEALAIRLPDKVPDIMAASALLKGITAYALTHVVHPVEAGQIVLVHAAAGGVGRLVAQWATARGAIVIGTVGSPEKVADARAAGCVHVILYREEDVVSRVRQITAGLGVNAVFDAVGRDTFDASLDVLAVRGQLVNYGQSSGPIGPFDIARLAPKSASISRPVYAHYIATAEERSRVVGALFDALADGTLEVAKPVVFDLEDAAQAHRALEAREAGPFVLVPDFQSGRHR